MENGTSIWQWKRTIKPDRIRTLFSISKDPNQKYQNKLIKTSILGPLHVTKHLEVYLTN
jgi:hypothetical protein